MPNDFNFDMSQVDFGGGADIDGFLSSPTNEDGGIYQTGSILQNIMPKSAAQPEFELGGENGVQTQGAPGLDALFAQEPQLVQATTNRRLVASINDLDQFTRISTEILVHKSNSDLWALKKEADGKFYVERLFDDNGEPLKG
jgi:hypothetical protein